MRTTAALVLLFTSMAHAEDVVKGSVPFRPSAVQDNVPKRYRLDSHDFDFELRLKQSLPVSGFDLFELRFPSPVESPHRENNTVHAEYYRPRRDTPGPCVIVLDITGGNQELSRTIARHLAQKNIGALFVQMAYYGPRRPPGSKLRLVSYDVAHSMDAIRQTVLDLRRAAAWMESRPEVDKTRLGIMGTSLGSFMAALTAEMEPKLARVAVLLGGGGFVDAYWNHPQAAPFRDVFKLVGGTKEQAKDFFAPIDPLTCAANLKDRRLLIVAAKHDEIVPPQMAENLWEATGRQRIIWLNAGHYSAAIYLMTGLHAVVEHFGSE
jgi:cephalosporin-C deacetylase-like acetyl esterase